MLVATTCLVRPLRLRLSSIAASSRPLHPSADDWRPTCPNVVVAAAGTGIPPALAGFLVVLAVVDAMAAARSALRMCVDR